MERGKEDEDARSYPLIPWSGSSAGPIWSSGSKQFQAGVGAGLKKLLERKDA